MPNNDGSLNMGPYEPVQEIEDPQNNEEVYQSFNTIWAPMLHVNF